MAADDQRPNPMIQVFQDAIGDPRVRCYAPGERAVSAVITDPLDLIHQVADQCGLEVDDSTENQLTISWPAGS
jgi:hypothetical protein